MQTNLRPDFGLSGNLLKIIAAVSMLIDHIGMIMFPRVAIFRILGRLAFPVFAFLICEGCYYTKNKAKYLGLMFGLGTATSIVYYIAMRQLYLNVLITFSCSIILIYLLRFTADREKVGEKIGFISAFAVLVAFFYFITLRVDIDYGFWGIILPVFPFAIEMIVPRNDKILLLQPRFLGFALGLFTLCFLAGGVQMYAMSALLPLALYNGKRGFPIPKYAFYVFYPAHIAILWAIAVCLG